MYNYILPEIVPGDDKKIVIYGTGEAAKQYYEQIEAKYGSGLISFFLETKPDKSMFFNIPVIRPEDLPKRAINHSLFLIASITNESSMVDKLLSLGICNENIVRAAGNCKAVKGLGEYNVLMDITNGCNLRCSFCTRNNSDIVFMSTEQFASVMDKLYNNTKSLQLSCAWEYSIHRNSLEIIKILGSYNIPSTTIYTNGNILPEPLVEQIIKSQIKYYVFSIGESKKSTYESIRRGGNFERVIGNIKKLSSLKKSQGAKYPKICTNLTLTSSNIGELIEFVELAHEIGVEEIRGRHLILNAGLDIEKEVVKNEEQANEIIIEASKRAGSYGIDFDIPLYQSNDSYKRCISAWTQLYISSDGSTSICPRIHMYENLGNIIEESLNDILKSDRLKALRSQFDCKKFNNPVCPICIDNKETKVYIDQGF